MSELNIAIKALEEGRLVGIPTETVYGLAGDALNDQAVARIYSVKNRPAFNPLIVHFFSIEQIQEFAFLSEIALDLAHTFWPGPMTLIVKRRPEAPLSYLLSCGLDTIGIRIPRHPIALELLRQFGRPLVAPSANPSGYISPTRKEHVTYSLQEHLGKDVALVLEGGESPVGIESTIIDVTKSVPVILRAGALLSEDIFSHLKVSFEYSSSSEGMITAPGQLSSHYSPNAQLRLDVDVLKEGEVLLAFDEVSPALKPHIAYNLSPTGDLSEAAANLFAMLRALDQSGSAKIAVSSIPMEGIGIAINDRLQRAAAPKG